MSACSILFPFQLFDPHPALQKGRPVVLIEDSLLFGDPHVEIHFHHQRSILLRAAMQAFAEKLRKRGYEIHYREFQEGVVIGDHLRALAESGFDEFHHCETTDFLLNKRLRRFRETSGLKFQTYDSPMFLTPRDVLDAHFQSGKRPFLAKFYEGQRKRMGVLVDTDGEPTGGKWSYDDENRKSMPKKGLEVPKNPGIAPTSKVGDVIRSVKEQFPHGYGNADGFAYPVTHEGALQWFERFLEERFHQFGPYEDAVSHRERVLFHSILTPMLNIGLLTPQQVLDRALEFASQTKVPLNSLEGFVRQIIGWREFMLGAYQHLGVKCRTTNFWGFEDRPIPASFYNATTGIDPIDCVIQRVLDHGYCHHIERLMIVGNFMLLCGFHPDRVYDWFMELFVDAYDWVMVPNVYGMSQFADGGLFTTKPYISGSNYVRKMSDHPRGDWCEVWDGLFWSFIKQHENFFRSQHRLGMMVRQLERMDAAKLNAHLRNAESFLSG